MLTFNKFHTCCSVYFFELKHSNNSWVKHSRYSQNLVCKTSLEHSVCLFLNGHQKKYFRHYNYLWKTSFFLFGFCFRYEWFTGYQGKGGDNRCSLWTIPLSGKHSDISLQFCIWFNTGYQNMRFIHLSKLAFDLHYCNFSKACGRFELALTIIAALHVKRPVKWTSHPKKSAKHLFLKKSFRLFSTKKFKFFSYWVPSSWCFQRGKNDRDIYYYYYYYCYYYFRFF